MGKIISKDKLNDSFCLSTRYEEFRNNSATEAMESFVNNSPSAQLDIRQNMLDRTQLTKSKLSFKKDTSDFSFNDKLKSSSNKMKKYSFDLLSTFNENEDRNKNKICNKRCFNTVEDQMFNVVPITLEIDNIYRSLIVKAGQPMKILESIIPGAQMEIKKIFSENNENKSLLNDIEKCFLLLRIDQEHLNKFPFIIDNEICDTKHLIPGISNQLIRSSHQEDNIILKLGFSTNDSGKLRYLMFIRASASIGWKNYNIFQQYSRTLIATERKTGCDIHISNSLFLYRGSEVKSLIIEGDTKNQIIRCKSLLPKFIQKNLICDVQNIDMESAQIK